MATEEEKLKDEIRKENQDNLDQLEGYEIRAGMYLSNVDLAVMKDEYEKASEFLWGSIACYLNAIYFLRTGKSCSGHNAMIALGERISVVTGDQRLENAIRIGEKMHSNHYHGFLRPEEFPGMYYEIMYAVSKLRELLILEKTRT